MTHEIHGEIYSKLAAISAELAKSGISKSRKNQKQGYSFRGIDETLNALAPLLATQGVVVVPRMVSRTMTERASTNGGALFSVVVDAEFTFVSVSDGSSVAARVFGEAMDSGDKATNKAMSVAYKYAAFLTFCIPVEAMAQDADAETHDVAADAGYDDFIAALDEVADRGTDALLAAIKSDDVPEPWRARLRQETATWARLKARAAKGGAA